MRRIPNFRSIDLIPNRSLRPGFRSAVSQAMKRAVVVIACCCVVLIDHRAALADAASDRDMATRYEQAARAGDDDAQFYLGALYASGVGRQRSDEEAFRWFLRAADQGHSHGMLIVAGLYASGRGVTKDNVKAYSWAYIVSSASKVDEYRNGARQLMSLLMNRMTSDEIGRAVVAARAWRAVRVCQQGCGHRKSGREFAGSTRAGYAPTSARGRAASARSRVGTCGLTAGAFQHHGIAGTVQGRVGTSGEECKERRCSRPGRPGSIGPAQAVWLLIHRTRHEIAASHRNRHSGCRHGRGRLLRLLPFLSSNVGDHQRCEPRAGFRSRLRNRHRRARALGQGGAAAAPPAGRAVQMRGTGGQVRPGARPPGRRRGAQRAGSDGNQSRPARTRSGARREGSRQERRRAHRVRAALDQARGSKIADRRAEGAARTRCC